MDPVDILALTSDRSEERVADGALILREGVRSGALFVLVDGVLEVRRRGRAVVRISAPGAVVGELGLLLDSPASADVIAIGDSTVRRIDDAAEVFAQVPEFARFLATLLAGRLWQISTYLSDLHEQFADQGEVLGLLPTVLQELMGSNASNLEPGSEREVDSPY